MKRSDRGISTVLDAALCLLLVSAAVGVLLAVPADEADADEAAEIATLVGTSTETVTYRPDPPETTADVNRTDHGTVARLLASAAVTAADVDDEPFVPDPAYRRAATDAAGTLVVPADARVEVQAIWEPVESGPLRGAVTVGSAPPPDKDVHAASLTVQLAADPEFDRAVRRSGFEGVAVVTARGAVDVAFPPDRIGPALHSKGDESAIVRARYRAAGRALGVDVTPALEAGDAAAANAALADALADEFEPALRTQYDDPEQAADDVSPTEVTVVVRTWAG